MKMKKDDFDKIYGKNVSNVKHKYFNYYDLIKNMNAVEKFYLTLCNRPSGEVIFEVKENETS